MVDAVPDHIYHAYILASHTRRIYVGMTSDLRVRVSQHRRGNLPGFTRRYGITILVHTEAFADVHAAIAREKQLKRWPRWRKLRLTDLSKPMWTDLSADCDADIVERAAMGARRAVSVPDGDSSAT